MLRVDTHTHTQRMKEKKETVAIIFRLNCKLNWTCHLCNKYYKSFLFTIFQKYRLSPSKTADPLEANVEFSRFKISLVLFWKEFRFEVQFVFVFFRTVEGRRRRLETFFLVLTKGKKREKRLNKQKRDRKTTTKWHTHTHKRGIDTHTQSTSYFCESFHQRVLSCCTLFLGFGSDRIRQSVQRNVAWRQRHNLRM